MSKATVARKPKTRKKPSKTNGKAAAKPTNGEAGPAPTELDATRTTIREAVANLQPKTRRQLVGEFRRQLSALDPAYTEPGFSPDIRVEVAALTKARNRELVFSAATGNPFGDEPHIHTLAQAIADQLEPLAMRAGFEDGITVGDIWYRVRAVAEAFDPTQDDEVSS